MDQEILVPKQQTNGSFLSAKLILILFGIIIVGEVIWAYKALFMTSTQTAQSLTNVAKPTTVSLTSGVTTLKVGQKTTVSINLSTTRMVDGVDLIITYDPKLLSIEPISGGQPVAVGSIFSDYPQNVADTTAGKITISGITSSQGGVLANGVFGSIVFVGKAPGQAKVSLDFAPGSTVKSNVAETKTGKNILEKVNNLDLTVTQ